MTKLLFFAVVNRTVGYSIAGYISALMAHQHARALALGLGAGLVVGVATGIATFCFPYVEWAAENVPAKRMGVIGVALIVIGFALQSVQYWVTLIGVGAS
jgi:Na+/H+ antiporter NhaA